MTYDEYLLYLKGTIDGYPSKVNNYIKKLFVKAGFAQDEPQMNINNILEDGTDVIELHDAEKIKTCLIENKKAVHMFEKWEFEKDYKYSVVLVADNFDKLLLEVSNIESLIDIEKDESSYIFDIITSPIRYSYGNYEILKFNLKYKANDPLSNKIIYLKYPLLMVLHKEECLVEFRFDIIKRIFIPERKDQTLYTDLVTGLREYLSINFNCILTPLDLNYIIEASKENQDEVRLMAQYMKLPGGGNAQLDVGKNEDFVLPLLGDLKELLSKYPNELDMVPVLKTALDQFVFENESLSDYPWIELMWENKIKSKSIKIKIVFNYRNTAYCLIQHYYNNLIGMERMNHVIRYISKHRTDIKAEDEFK